MRVLSLGGGVQSTALLLMAHHGDIEPLDAVIFADTQWERRATYDHLHFLIETCGADQPIYVETGGSIREDSLVKQGRIVSMPAFVLNSDGTKGQLRRQCTKEYKIRVIKRKVRALGATAADPADMIIGISWGEWTRVHDPDVRYMRNVYPLIERQVTRRDCEAWLQGHGYPIPPKSACIGCPYRSAREWRNLTPDERADANAFDHEMRGAFRARSIKGQVYLHPSLKPLATIDFRSEQERGQMELWDQECAGVCFV